MGNASYENETDRHVPGEKSEKYRYTELDENLFGIGKIQVHNFVILFMFQAKEIFPRDDHLLQHMCSKIQVFFLALYNRKMFLSSETNNLQCFAIDY